MNIDNSSLRHSPTNENKTGYTCHIKNINDLGSDIDQWLHLLRGYLKLNDGRNKNKILKHFFLRAKKELDLEANKNNETYAKLLSQEALYISNNSIDDARDAFQSAANNLRRVSYIHIAYAQFELDQGRSDKAWKVLQFAKMVLPNDTAISEAITKVNSGKIEILLDKDLTSPLQNITNVAPSKKVPVVEKSQQKYVIEETPSLLDLKRSMETSSNNCYSGSYSMVEALDLPSSPMTPDLSFKFKSRVTTPISINRPSVSVFNLATKSQQSSKKKSSENSSTWSSNFLAKPRRVRCSSKKETDDNVNESKGDFLKETESQEWLSSNRIVIHKKTYIIMNPLGVGGSSKVYRVIDVANKSTKALKQVDFKGCDNSIKEGFLNEISFLEKLQDHPNIISLHDYEITDEYLFIVMECGSTDLAKFMQEHRSRADHMDPWQVWYFWKGMLAAVKTIHDHGVIHLDLKPANFIIVKGKLKLIDFGIASSIQADATSVIQDTQKGTLNYMAPEAILDMSGNYQSTTPRFKISPRADVWSLGCILYSMMYGKTPFQHVSHQLLKLNAITNPSHRIPFEEYEDKVLQKVVQRCLLRNPKERPTVEQLLHNSWLN